MWDGLGDKDVLKATASKQKFVRPRVSLYASFTDVFLDAIAKAKKLIPESIAQNLMPVSLTKIFLALAMAFNSLLSNPT